MIRKSALVAGFIALCLSVEAKAEQFLNLMVTTHGGVALLAFKSDMSASDAFMIRVIGIAAPGSRIRISIDRAPHTLYDRIVAPAQCDFTDGPAKCMVPIDGASPEFRALVAAFKAGVVAHIEITTAGSAPVTSNTSLAGFTKAFAKL